jgi:hypothetical protein
MNFKLKNITLLFLLIGFISYAQMRRTDSIGNFFVENNKLIWQKHYELEDVNLLDQKLKQNVLTNNLDILHYETSAISDLVYIDGNNLPIYTRKGFKAFVIVDLERNQYRVTIKQITFPDFVENVYYNGMRQNSRTGALESYILRQNGDINRNNTTKNVLDSFDYIFNTVFED